VAQVESVIMGTVGSCLGWNGTGAICAARPLAVKKSM
jgi:hypothetical protein